MRFQGKGWTSLGLVSSLALVLTACGATNPSDADEIVASAWEKNESPNFDW